MRALSAFFADQGQTLDVLIELGVPGGRCGCRSVDDALALAQRVSDLPGLRLRGLELYEGVLHGDDPQPQVEALLQQAAALPAAWSRWLTANLFSPARAPSGMTWYATSGWRRQNRAAAVSSSALAVISPTIAGSTISPNKS